MAPVFVGGQRLGPCSNYRDLIKSELLARVKKNAAYSARAFARDLRISNPFLCQILNGARSLSEEKGLQIARSLEWDEIKIGAFLKLIRLEQCKDPSLKSRLYSEIREDSPNVFFNLEIEKFELVSDWIHFAIMELTRVRGFKSDPKWISKRLGVTAREIEDAIRRLLATGLLHREKGKLKITKDVTVRDVPSGAIRKFHRTHLEKAIVALERQRHERRHFSGITLAINPKNIPLAAEQIKKFRRKLIKTLDDGDLTSVYQLSIQLFQLDETELMQ